MHVFWNGLHLAVVFAQFVTPVTAHYPNFPIVGVEGKELATRTDTYVSERACIEVAVLGLGRIDYVQRLSNGEYNLDRARQRIRRWYDAPRYHGFSWWDSEELWARLCIRSDGYEVVVPQQCDETGAIELAGLDAVFLCAVTKRKGYEVALEIIIAAHCAIFRDHEQLLVVGPAQSLDRAFIPIDAPYEFAGAAVDIDARLVGLPTPVGDYLVFIAVYSCQCVSARTAGEIAKVVPTAPLYGAPTT